MQKDFWKINLNALLIDAALILYSFLFSNLIFGHLNFFSNTTPMLNYIVFSCINLLMFWYIGWIYAHYKKFYSEIVSILAFVLMIIASLFIVFYQLYFSFKGWETENWDKEAFLPCVSFFLVFTIWGGQVGFKMGKGILEEKDYKISSDNNFWYSLFLLITIPSWIFVTNYFTNGFAIFSLMILSMVLGFVISKSIAGILDIEKINRIVFIIFPLVIISGLILWNEIGLHYIQQFGNKVHIKISWTDLILLLSAMGFIPFRIVLLFAPPLRAINIAIGISAMAFYLWSLQNNW